MLAEGLPGLAAHGAAARAAGTQLVALAMAEDRKVRERRGRAGEASSSAGAPRPRTASAVPRVWDWRGLAGIGGDWRRPPCVLCRCSDFTREGFGPRTTLLCGQCEREYHVGCLEERGMARLTALPAD